MILFQDTLKDRDNVAIDMEDRGYQFGDGVYEVIRVYQGQFFTFAEHMARLERSVKEIRMELPYPIDTIKTKLKELAEKNQLTDGIIYLQITRGPAPRSHELPKKAEPVLIAYTKDMSRPVHNLTHGIHTILTEDVRWLRCDIKSLNLLANVMAKQEAKDQECTEAILHRGDIVSEGSSSNVFMVKDHTLYTHPANQLILSGITRQSILKLVEQLHLSFSETSFTTEELLTADEIFITSTTSEITPVVKVNDTMIGQGTPGHMTQQLQEAFVQLFPDNK